MENANEYNQGQQKANVKHRDAMEGQNEQDDEMQCYSPAIFNQWRPA